MPLSRERERGRAELVAALLLSIVLARTGWTAEAESPLAAIEKRLSAATEKVRPAIVGLSWTKDEHPGSCSGVIVTADGYVATQSCRHLPREEPVHVDLADGRRVSGKLLGWCGTLGIGLMKITDQGPWPHVALSPLPEVKPGDLCISLGYPELPAAGGSLVHDRGPSLRVGCISASAAPRWLMSTCPVDHGDWGGGLFDLEGRLLALHATKWRGHTVHVGIELFQKSWGDLAAGKEVVLPLGGPKRPGEPPKPAAAKTQPASAEDRTAAALRKARPATIWFRPGCSGVIVSEDGYVATCAHHQLLPGREIKVFLPDGRTAAGRVLGSDPLCDVGMLKIDDKDSWPFVELGDSRSMKAGDACLHLGYPGGARVKQGRPWGRVSRLLDPPSKLVFLNPSREIYTPGPLFPGDSGGGVFDLEGRLIGIHQGGIPDEAVNWSGRIESIREQWDLLAAGKPAEVLSFVGRGPIAKAFRRAVPGTPPFAVEVHDKKGRRALGTIVGRGGWILSKASELEGEISCRLAGERSLPAKIHKVSPEHDLALLKVDAADLVEAAWSPRAEIAVGTLVAALGWRDAPVAGVVSQPIRAVPRELGALVIGKLVDGEGGVEVEDDAIARKFHLPIFRGDVIVHIEGRPTPNRKALVELPEHRGIAVPSAIAGDRIRVGIRRHGKPLELRFPLPSPSGMPTHRRSAFPSAFDADIALTPALCGGPVVDRSGQVRGVAIACSGEGRVHVIPAAVARKVAEELRK